METGGQILSRLHLKTDLITAAQLDPFRRKLQMLLTNVSFKLKSNKGSNEWILSQDTQVSSLIYLNPTVHRTQNQGLLKLFRCVQHREGRAGDVHHVKPFSHFGSAIVHMVYEDCSPCGLGGITSSLNEQKWSCRNMLGFKCKFSWK